MTDQEFELGFYQNFPKVKAFLLSKGCTPDEAEELAQETFYQAYRKRDQFRGRFFISWLKSIADNLWKNYLRKKSTKKREADLLPLSEETHSGGQEDNPLGQLINKEKIKLVEAAVGELPPKMRHCLTLRLVQELKYEEIAVVLQVSIDTVKSQLSKARQRIRDALTKPECEN